ncbi:hypothetical protein V8F33_009871 [Rhypophila sp. PSN 637]
MKLLVLLLLGIFATFSAAKQCTEGRSWTKEEFTKYQELKKTNKTLDGWSGMSVIPQCTFEESDFTTGADDGGHDHNTTTATAAYQLERRGGNNQWNGYTGSGCSLGNSVIQVNNFGCGGCYTSNFALGSGWLWRQILGGKYPTVDYFSGSYCTGAWIDHQEIPAGEYADCNNYYGGFRSVIVYQGC